MANTHVIDRDGHVWALVRDGGMVTRATETSPISAGIRWLEVTAGPLVEFDPVVEYRRLIEDVSDVNGCPMVPHHGVDCPGDACRYAGGE